MVHRLTPRVRDFDAQLSVLQLLQFRKPLVGPLLEAPRSRHELPAALRRPPPAQVGQEEGTKRIGISWAEVPVRHAVCAKDDQSARKRLHLIRIRVLRLVRLQLQAACLGAEEEDGHKPVPQELRLPLGDFRLRQLRRHLRHVPDAVDDAGTPDGEAQVDEADVRLQQVAKARERMVHHPQVAALARLFRRCLGHYLQVRNAGRTLCPQEALSHGVVHLVEGACLGFRHCPVQGDLLKAGVQHAETLDGQVLHDQCPDGFGWDATYFHVEMTSALPVRHRALSLESGKPNCNNQ
mmetsp:Transcript_9249/g.25891  ORF Transcript_9249/g.25891 Transcript_9249/m.25891 type:complete len:294 (-) Transcript_9249:12-893(-)